MICYISGFTFSRVKDKTKALPLQPGEKRRRGGQPGNQNAKGNQGGAPLGNKNAWKHGMYSRYFQVKPMYPWEWDEVRKAQERVKQKRIEGIEAAFADGLLTLDEDNKIHMHTESGDFIIGYAVEEAESTKAEQAV